MATLQTDENQARTRRSGVRKHSDSFPPKPASREMYAAIQRLIPGQISRTDLLALFDQRADYKTIQAWRYGWRGTPQWAVDLIRNKLATRAAADLAAGAKLQVGKGLSGGGAIGAKALAAWRERKARERDEKEKAAQDRAALNSDLE